MAVLTSPDKMGSGAKSRANIPGKGPDIGSFTANNPDFNHGQIEMRSVQFRGSSISLWLEFQSFSFPGQFIGPFAVYKPG